MVLYCDVVGLQSPAYCCRDSLLNMSQHQPYRNSICFLNQRPLVIVLATRVHRSVFAALKLPPRDVIQWTFPEGVF